MREDQEFKEYRDLVKKPDAFEEGVNLRTVFMALFVGLVLAPAQVYMQLVAGQGLGGSAQWVTVILYVEIARRAFVKLKSPQIFVLFYMCGAVVSSGGMGLLQRQFYMQSEELKRIGITEHIPSWFAPSDPSVLAERNFFHEAWLIPLLIITMLMILNRLDNFGLGYVMFRLTADVEKLPFPMAPVGAMGIMALADASQQKETWRWRTFSIGAMGGVAFGFVYLAIPVVTGAVFTTSLEIIPLPFYDMTKYTQEYLPAMPMMFSFDLAHVVIGMALPFWAMVGGFIGLLITLVANPALYSAGLLESWKPGMGGPQTGLVNFYDFYFSFGVGLNIAVGAIGIYYVVNALRKARKKDGETGNRIQWQRIFEPTAGRGDIPLWAAIAIYLFSTAAYVGVSYWLINYASGPLLGAKFPLWILVAFGFVYTPIISYISTRMEGIVGRQVSIPYVREAAFILSGYKGAAVWFAPIPLADHSGQALSFKTTELTGTKFTSLIKAEAIILPIAIVGMIMFSQFIWSLDSVPSQIFPYANRWWEIEAAQTGLLWSATLPGGSSPFLYYFKPFLAVIGFALALVVYASLNHFGLPIFLVYGVVGGLNQTNPSVVISMFIGALLGRYIFRKKFGEMWNQYRIVFAAGFIAGTGLITMLSLGIVFLTKSVLKLPM